MMITITFLTARFLSNPLEGHLDKYRQMNDDRFLVSLREVSNSEMILKISSVLKENIHF